MEISGGSRRAAEQELEARIQEAQLVPSDTFWLREIVPSDQQPIMLSWMNQTNALIIEAAPEISGGEHALANGKNQIVRARTRLFDRLGLEETRTEMAKTQPTLVSSLNLIPLCRLFHKYGVDLRKIASFAGAFKYSPGTVEEKLQAFVDNGIDPGEAIAAQPNHLNAPANRIGRVVRIANVLDWQGSKTDLVNQSVIRDKLSKTFFLAHLAANHLLSKDKYLLPRHIDQVARCAPEAHLITLIERDVYDPLSARYISAATIGQDRRELLLGLLRQPNVCRRIGGPTLRAYFRYKPLTPQERKRHKTVAKHEKGRFIDFENPFLDRDALLTATDDHWMAKVAAGDIEIDATLRERLNDWIRLGSRDARFQRNRGKENPTVQARDAFFADFGWFSLADDHPLKTRITSFLDRQPTGIPPASIVRAMRFCEAEGVDPVQFMVRSPSLVPTDITPYPERAAKMRSLFETAGRGENETELLNKFVGVLAKTTEHIQSLTSITAAYQQRLSRPLTDADLRNILTTTIEAHILTLLRDGQMDPKYANKYQRTQPLSNLTGQLTAFLGEKGVAAQNPREAGLALLTPEC